MVRSRCTCAMSPLMAAPQKPRACSLLGQFVGGQLGAREDDHAVERLGFEDARQRIELVHAADQPVALADVVGGAGLGSDGDFGGILQVGLRDALDGRRHGRREQRGLARLRGLLQDRLDIVDEAHAQHFVGFVEHQGPQLREVERALFEVIDDAARRADHDVHAARKRGELRAVALAAVDRQHVEAGKMGGVASGRPRPPGSPARASAPAPAPAACVAGCRGATGSAARRRRSCRCRSAPGRARRAWQQQFRNGGGLDRRRRLVAEFLQHAQQGLAQFQVGEQGGACFGWDVAHGGGYSKW